MPRSPLLPREGISATSLRAPGGKATHAKNHLPVPASIGDWLEHEFPEATAEARHSLLTRGDMCDETGKPVTWDDPVIPGGFYFFHRPVPAEERIPFEVGIVFEDADLLVVDKPHFLASTPNGRFVRECVVTRLRIDLDLPELVAIRDHAYQELAEGCTCLVEMLLGRPRDPQITEHGRRLHALVDGLAIHLLMHPPPEDSDWAIAILRDELTRIAEETG